MRRKQGKSKYTHATGDRENTRRYDSAMDRERAIFRNFLQFHGHKTQRGTKEPAVHLQFYKENEPFTSDTELILFTPDDIREELDPDNSSLVRWLFEQMKTYTCTRQVIVGLVFSKTVVLSEVLAVVATE